MNIADVANEYRDTYAWKWPPKTPPTAPGATTPSCSTSTTRVALQQFVVDGEDTANGSAITLSNGEKEYIQGLIDSQNSTAAQPGRVGIPAGTSP